MNEANTTGFIIKNMKTCPKAPYTTLKKCAIKETASKKKVNTFKMYCKNILIEHGK